MKTLMLIVMVQWARSDYSLPDEIALRYIVARPHHHQAILERFKGAVTPIDSLDNNIVPLI